MQELVKDFGVYIIMGLFAIIFWFLRDKLETVKSEMADAKVNHDKQIEDLKEVHQKQISLLFVKHDQDVEKLSELEKRISREHYMKNELDNRFERLEDAFETGLATLGGKIDKLAEVMMRHITKVE